MNSRNQVMIAGAVVLLILVAGFAFYMVDIDQTKEARLPDVDVTVSGGQAPEFDADVGSVQLPEEKVTVPVPEVTVKEEEVTVPGIEITPPADDNPADN